MRSGTIPGVRELPLACSLDGAAMAERLAHMRSIGRDSLIAAEPGGVLRFDASPATRSRLEQIVAAEAQCCPFLGLDLAEEAGTLRLTVSAPEGAEPVVEGLIEAFSA